MKGSDLFFLPNPYQNFYVSCAESWCPFCLSFHEIYCAIPACSCLCSDYDIPQKSILWTRIKCSINFIIKSLVAGELHHEFRLHSETLFEKVISMQHMFQFCFALILIVSSITVPERTAEYISFGSCKKYTVTEHKWLLTNRLFLGLWAGKSHCTPKTQLQLWVLLLQEDWNSTCHSKWCCAST